MTGKSSVNIIQDSEANISAQHHSQKKNPRVPETLPQARRAECALVSTEEGAKTAHRLIKVVSLRGKAAFRNIFSTGKRYRREGLTLLVRGNDVGVHRLGIVTPKRIGNAVVRNRIRRQAREAFWRVVDEACARDWVMLLGPEAVAGGFQGLMVQLQSIFTRI